MIRQPPRYNLIPYTTLFRSRGERGDDEHQIVEAGRSRDRERCRPKREIGLRNARKSHVTAGEADPVLGDGLPDNRSEENTSELQSQSNLVCRLLLEKQNALV